MQNPLVSIIIPNFNREKLIGETLESFIAQDYRNWECIIVDDGSTDRSVEIIEEYCQKDPRFRLLIRPEEMPKGANTCRNLGFEAAKGKYINWFDSDDLTLPTYISERVNILEEAPQLDLVICAGTIVDENLNPIQDWDLKEDNTTFYLDYINWKQRIGTPAIMFKKEFLKGKDLFDPLVTRGQESDLFYRILFQFPSERYRVINRKLYLYRQHSQSKSAQRYRYNPSQLQSRMRVYFKMLKLSTDAKNKAVTTAFYKVTVIEFQKAVFNRDFANAKSIFIRLNKLLYKHSIKHFLEFNFYYVPLYFLVMLKKSIENRFRR